jgi:cyclopropane fatty-acyl-phospholipid synthase-like methyltransferase
MWEKRFATDEYIFGTQPAQFMLDHQAYLSPGATALAVADGEGRNSVYMAERGMNVTALEYAPSAIRKAQALADTRGVQVDFQQTDVLTHDWPQQYDVVAGIFIQFVGPDDRKRLFEGMKASVKPGGLMLLHGHTPKQLDYGTGGPSNRLNMYTEVILRAAFVGWQVLECREYDHEVQEGRGHSGMSALIDFVARKPE